MEEEEERLSQKTAPTNLSLTSETVTKKRKKESLGGGGY